MINILLSGYSYGYRYGYGYGYDWTYILVLIGAVFCLITSAIVKSTFEKYAKVAAHCGMTGQEVAAAILKSEGIYDVRIEPIRGSLTDNFNPSTKVLHLSESVYNSTSVAAISVAAHECGHAIQHNEEYFPIKARSAILPVANFGSRFGLWIVIAGLLISFLRPLTVIGVLLFSFAVFFQLITLPVEFDASSRALAVLNDMNIITNSHEMNGAKKVLKSAAMTYVASAASAILTLLRLILLSRSGSSKRR